MPAERSASARKLGIDGDDLHGAGRGAALIGTDFGDPDLTITEHRAVAVHEQLIVALIQDRPAHLGCENPIIMSANCGRRSIEAGPAIGSGSVGRRDPERVADHSQHMGAIIRPDSLSEFREEGSIGRMTEFFRKPLRGSRHRDEKRQAGKYAQEHDLFYRGPRYSKSD